MATALRSLGTSLIARPTLAPRLLPSLRDRQTPFSTSPARFRSPISPAFERFPPQSNPTSSHKPGQPLVILHGLFGSKNNWRSIAKKLAHASGQEVFALDLRNHGESEATPGATSYLDYASDVKEFIRSHSLENVNLIGHSMGGKVAMTVALEDPESPLISKLIVLDISPAKGNISPSFQVYLDGMREINSRLVTSRKQADEIFSKYEQDQAVRHFILTNLKHCSESTGDRYKIRLPLEVLRQQLNSNSVGDFPFEPSTDPDSLPSPTAVRFEKPALFIKGAQSKYINRHNIPVIKAFFPSHQLVVFDTGHWVHAERPNDFITTVVDFINHDKR